MTDNKNKQSLDYISEYMLQKLYKILKVNLTTGDFEIIKAIDEELVSEKGYNDTSIYAWLNGIADSGILYSEDVEAFRRHVDPSFLHRFFTFTDALYRIRYRRLVRNEYRWVMLEMVPAKEYTDDNQVVILSVQDVDQDIIEILETAKREHMLSQLEAQYETIRSIASIYTSLHVINLFDDTSTEFTATERLHDLVLQKGHASEQIDYVIRNTITQNDLDRALEFTDLSTLKSRLGDEKLISADFIGTGLGWIRIQFIANSYSESGRLMTVICTTRIIENEKQREEKLIRMSTTDELTRLYNRRSYEQDIARYAKVDLDDDLIVIFMDLNGLKHINDNVGHAAGDELICGAAHSMMKVLGSVSKVYRVGGDEFAALMHYDSDKISVIKSEFDEVTKKWHGELVPSLSVAWGHASHKDYPELSVEQLCEIADKAMYEDKERYYRENNIDRRKN